MREEADILAQIAGNTIVVITLLPEKRAEWLAGIRQAHTQALFFADEALAALADSIAKLLQGRLPESINPNLTGPYLDCWLQIIGNIREFSIEDGATAKALRSFLEATREDSWEVFISRKKYLSSATVHQMFAMLIVSNRNNLEVVRLVEEREEMLNYFLQQTRESQESDEDANISPALRALLAKISNLTEPIDMTEREEACRAAINLLNQDQPSPTWAALQEMLANSLAQNPLGNRAEKIEEAIKHYEQALEVFAPTNFPERWGAIQTGLGNALIERIQGERAKNIQDAIKHFKQALGTLDLDKSPDQYVIVLNNLGSAYSKIVDSQGENREQAIEVFQRALEIAPPGLPIWATIHNNLGTAYRQRLSNEPAKNIEVAISHHQKALSVFTRETSPFDWAWTHGKLGDAYSDLIEKDLGGDIDEAISHYTFALQVFTEKDFPYQWAGIQHNMGCTYRAMSQNGHKEDAQHAITHFNLALRVIRQELFPFEYQKTMWNLGSVQFLLEKWQEAVDAFQSVIEVGNGLLATAYTEAGKRTEVETMAGLHAEIIAAYCLLKLGKPAEAFMQLDRGKTRLLAKALSLHDIDLKALPEQQRRSMLDARETLAKLQSKARLPTETMARPDDDELAVLLKNAYNELDHCVKRIREDFPDFMPDGSDIAEITRMIPDHSALVVPVITSLGSAVFVIPQGAQTITSEHVIWVDHFTEKTLQGHLMGSAYSPGWLPTYLQHTNAIGMSRAEEQVMSEAWQATLDYVLNKVWHSLLEPVHTQLLKLGIRHVIWLPSRGLQLLPVHAVWRMIDGKRRYFLDDFEEISYAPSIYVFGISQRRSPERRGRAGLIVGIDEYHKLPPLFTACYEARAIAEIFHTKPLLNAEATQDALKSTMPGKAYVHLACHGDFKWGGDPLDSALFLANDTPFSVTEIITELDLSSARLVVLSACETAIADMQRSPEEHVGLPAAFLQSGAPAVISSLWAVDGYSTALLMERFYYFHLERHFPPSRALREAQIWLRDVTRSKLGEYYLSQLRIGAQEAQKPYTKTMLEGDPSDTLFADPFYWAAFIFTGT